MVFIIKKIKNLNMGNSNVERVSSWSQLFCWAHGWSLIWLIVKHKEDQFHFSCNKTSWKERTERGSQGPFLLTGLSFLPDPLILQGSGSSQSGSYCNQNTSLFITLKSNLLAESIWKYACTEPRILMVNQKWHIILLIA